jgi:L-ascorbate metabolism protein UlaG (beta-lactamase superfamily)
MRRLIRILGTILLFATVALCFAITIVPLFLDRVYYRGPISGHYDGQRFFNPEGQQGSGGSQRNYGSAGFLRFLSGADQAPWPASVPVTPTQPAARVAGDAMRVTWIGHATVLVQTQGLNILTDPIWSERASPVPFAGPKRVRAPGVRFDDLPKIDVVLVSHNHYDHLDLATLRRLWTRDRPLIVTSLGNEAVIAQAGAQAVTRDWGGRVNLRPGIDVIVARVHHWGSRWGRDRNRALWSGFTITLPGGNLFFAGDTGFGKGAWVADAARHGPYRMALLPIGAFRPREVMSGNHISPPQAVSVYERLGAAYALGIHWGTFHLTNERIDEPRELLATTLTARGIAADRFRAIEAGTGWDVPVVGASGQ